MMGHTSTAHYTRPAAAVVLTLLLLLIASPASADGPGKRPAASVDVAGGTITASLVCLPVSGTLPLMVQISSTTYNQTSHERFCYGQVDLQTAGGLYMASISAGTITLPGGVGEFVQVGWFKPLPARINYVGDNRYIFTIHDITAPPYNQPPYPPSGSRATSQCTVDGRIP